MLSRWARAGLAGTRVCRHCRAGAAVPARAMGTEAPSTKAARELDTAGRGRRPGRGEPEMASAMFRHIAAEETDEAWAEYCDMVERAGRVPAHVHSEMLQAIKPGFVARFNVLATPDPERAVQVMLFRVRRIWNEMRRAGCTPSLTDYSRLMEAARISKNVGMADEVMAELRGAALPLDLFTMHSYLTLHVGSPRDFLRGSFVEAGDGGSVGDRVAHVLDTVNAGSSLVFTSETFSLLLLARARDVDMARMDLLMDVVWGLATGEGAAGAGAPARPGSPTYPTAWTLYTVATAYGYVGRVADAYELVRQMSQQYRIRIDQRTWAALLHWARQRSSKHQRRHPLLPVHNASAQLMLRLYREMRERAPGMPLTARMWRDVVRHEILRGNLEGASELLVQWTLELLAQQRVPATAAEGKYQNEFNYAFSMNSIEKMVHALLNKAETVVKSPRARHMGPFEHAALLETMWLRVQQLWSKNALTAEHFDFARPNGTDSGIISRDEWHLIQNELWKRSIVNLKYGMSREELRDAVRVEARA